MNTKRILSLLFVFVASIFALADDAHSTGYGEMPAPIDTNKVILIIAAVLLAVGVIAYRKLSIKKA